MSPPHPHTALTLLPDDLPPVGEPPVCPLCKPPLPDDPPRRALPIARPSAAKPFSPVPPVPRSGESIMPSSPSQPAPPAPPSAPSPGAEPQSAAELSPLPLPLPLPPPPLSPPSLPSTTPASPPAAATTSQKRPFCKRCARPTRVCICTVLPPQLLPTATRILIIQTASEAKAKVRTGDLVPLILSHARMLPARDAAAAIPPDAILLFPGMDAVPLQRVAAPGRALVLLDGTWDMARRLLARSSALQALQRAFIPDRFLGPPLFLARKAPVKAVKGARSTAEAVAGALQCVEGAEAGNAVAAIRRCVHVVSESQLHFVRAKGPNAGRHRKGRPGYEEGLYEKTDSEEP